MEWQLKQGKKIGDWWRKLFSSCEIWCFLWSSLRRKAMEMSSPETLTDTSRLKNTPYNSLQIALVQKWNGGRINNLMKKLPSLTSLNVVLWLGFFFLKQTKLLFSKRFNIFYLLFMQLEWWSHCLSYYHYHCLPSAHAQLLLSLARSREDLGWHPLLPQSLSPAMTAAWANVPDLLCIMVCTRRRWEVSSPWVLLGDHYPYTYTDGKGKYRDYFPQWKNKKALR